MPDPSEWTDADFIPREPEPADPTAIPTAAQKKAEDDERREWLRREIRSRIMAGETQPQVVGWLVAEGLDAGAAANVVAWAATSGHPSHSRGDSDRVLWVEVHSRLSSKTQTHVNTDPVASARARAAARKQRTTIQGTTNAPAPEFEFARPTDSAQAKLARDSKQSAAPFVLAAIIVFLVVVAAVTVALMF